MSKDRFSVLPQIYRSVKRQTQANRTECLLENCTKCDFRIQSSAKDVHFLTFFPYGQAMVFEKCVISVELTKYVCYVILH